MDGLQTKRWLKAMPKYWNQIEKTKKQIELFIKVN